MADIQEDVYMGKERILISVEEAQNLRVYFLENHAELWSDTDASHFITHLHALPEYARLHRTHVRYQFTKFVLEFRLRKHIGEKFKQITETYKTVGDKFFTDGILQILSNVYLSFENNSRYTQVLPHDFEQFLLRCHNELIHNISGSAIRFVNEHEETDAIHRVLFANFIKKHLCSVYGDCWMKFADINHVVPGVYNGAGNVTDLLLSSMELDVAKSRYNSIKENTQLFQAFINTTYVKPSIVNVNNVSILFPPNKLNAPLYQYPDYVKNFIIDRDKTPLLKLILFVFEEHSWEYYISNLSLQEVYLFKNVQSLELHDKNESLTTLSVSETLTITYAMQELLYYITGSTISAVINTLHNTESEVNKTAENLIRQHLLVNKNDAVNLKLPCELQIERERIENRLIYVNQDVLQIILNIESNILSPLLSDFRLLAAFGDNFMLFINSVIKGEGFFDQMKFLFRSALNDLSSLISTSEIDQLSCDLTNKFFEYYGHVTAKDYVHKIMVTQKLKYNPLRSVSFRLKILTGTFVKDGNLVSVLKVVSKKKRRRRGEVVF